MTRVEFIPARDANSRQDAKIHRCPCGELVYDALVCRRCVEATREAA